MGVDVLQDEVTKMIAAQKKKSLDHVARKNAKNLESVPEKDKNHLIS